jgi:hypothetical protein
MSKAIAPRSALWFWEERWQPGISGPFGWYPNSSEWMRLVLLLGQLIDRDDKARL